ncbi:hypothetical protein FIBSPDRAFT_873792, partial [Athelia psychrophila]
MPVPGWPDGASLTSQRGTGDARHCQVYLCTALIYNPSPIAEHKAPTSTQATASSARASSSPPF